MCGGGGEGDETGSSQSECKRTNAVKLGMQMRVTGSIEKGNTVVCRLKLTASEQTDPPQINFAGPSITKSKSGSALREHGCVSMSVTTVG